jgi:predicted dehydrogenase
MEPMNRRSFLVQAARASGAALAAPSVITSSALGGTAAAPAGERVTVGMIGVGGQAQWHVDRFIAFPDAQVVAVCDVRAAHRDGTKKRIEESYAKKTDQPGYKGCDAYNDFRELLARKDIDAVCICTPDHWHAIIAIEAARAGKDIYLEKPMNISVAEGRAICNAVKEHSRIFQHGTQQRSGATFRFAVGLVRGGKIGKLRRIRVAAPASVAGPVVQPMAVPPGLDYEMWIGPAPLKPYTDLRCGRGTWYHICDYTIGGFIGGWGVHHIDVAQWGNDADATGPIEIAGTGVVPREGIYDAPTAFRFEYRYANGVIVSFSDDRQETHGVRFEGDEGWVWCSRDRVDAEPKSLLQGQPAPSEVGIFKNPRHHRDFIDCIKTRKQTVCPVEVAHRSTTICSLAHIAMLTGVKLRWDPEKERFVSNDEANRMLTRPMRPPWHL